jgi:hypothetical protein
MSAAYVEGTHTAGSEWSRHAGGQGAATEPIIRHF